MRSRNLLVMSAKIDVLFPVRERVRVCYDAVDAVRLTI